MKPDPHYMSVLSPMLIVIRVPSVNEPRWRRVLRALTGVMREHELRQKDISSIEGLLPREEPDGPEDKVMRRKLDSAFEGSQRYFAAFALYDWNHQTESFDLIRPAVAT